MPRGRIANTVEDFWSYVDRSGECWIWKGPVHTSGYGTFNLNKRPYQAHRVAYALAHPGATEFWAPIDKGSPGFVLHRCDVRRCCNPNHLYLGSYVENMRDMISRGRHGALSGQENHASKLKNSDIPIIRKLIDDADVSQWDIARMYGVSQAVISLIKLGKTYRNVK